MPRARPAALVLMAAPVLGACVVALWPASGHADAAGLGNVPVGDGSATLPIGDQPVGNREGGGCTFPSSPLLAYRSSSIDGAGGNPGDSQPISTWVNLGSVSNANVTGVATERPTFLADCGNGKPCTDWNTVNRLTSGAFTAITQPFTLCAVVAMDETPSGNRVVASDADAAAWYLKTSNLIGAAVYAGTAERSVGSQLSSGSIHVLCAYSNGASSFASLDGTNGTAGNAGANGLDDIKIGAYQNNALQWNNKIFDVGAWEGDQVAAFTSWAECEYGSMPGALSMPVGAEYIFDGRDIDGDGSLNSNTTSGDLEATFVNTGATSGNCTQADDEDKPVAVKAAGNDWLAFDGVSDWCTVASSDTGMQFMHEAATFDVFVCGRVDKIETANLFASATATSENGWRLLLNANGTLTFRSFRVGGLVIDKTSTFTVTPGVLGCYEFRSNGTTFGMSNDLSAFETVSVGTKGTGAASNLLAMGATYAGTSTSEFAVYYLAMYDAQLGTAQQATAKRYLDDNFADTYSVHVATIGDSITEGAAANLDVPWPLVLEASLGVPVSNHGISGNTAAQCLTNWTDNVSGGPYTHLTIQCGVNSLRADVTASSISADLTTIISEAQAEGMTVRWGQVLPWRLGGLWNASRQAETDTLNATIAAHSVGALFYDDFEDDVTADALEADYSSDNLHVNQVGGNILAATWETYLGL